MIDIKELNERIEQKSAFTQTLLTGMDKVIVGQKHLVESLLIGLLADGHILLEGVPADVDLDAIEADLKALDNVTGVHDLHVWSITSGKHTLTAHLVVTTTDWQKVLDAAQLMLAKNYQLNHVTIQCENAICEVGHIDAHQFKQTSETHDDA